MKPRDMIAVAVVATIAVIGVAWFAFIAPKHKEAGRLADRVEVQRTELSTARDQVRVYEAARAAYPSNYAAVARLGKAIPATADTASLIEQLSQSSRKTHVGFRAVSVVGGGTDPAAPGVAAGPTTNPFQFTFQGRFFRLSRFLRFLERYVDVRNGGLVVDGRLLTIDGFTLGGGDKPATADSEGNVSAVVKATAYSIADLLNGATPGAPAPATPAAAAGSAESSRSTAPPAAAIGVTP